MGMEFFYFTLENAWKVFTILPHKALTTVDGHVQCPLGVYRPDQPVKVSRFPVLFCPVLATIGPHTLTEQKGSTTTNAKAQSKTLRCNNEPQLTK
jgi:hypothetical protein